MTDTCRNKTMVVKRVVERERERETVQQRRDYSTCVMIYSYLMVITKSYVRFGVEKEKYQVFIDELIS